MTTTTKNGESKMKSMNEIYQAGIAVAEILDGWKTTGFVCGDSSVDVAVVCRNAIEAASEILPGFALSITLQIAEYLVGLDKDGEKALQSFIDNDVVLADTVRAELVAYTNGGTN
jgi:hypothetical protein